MLYLRFVFSVIELFSNTHYVLLLYSTAREKFMLDFWHSFHYATLFFHSLLPYAYVLNLRTLFICFTTLFFTVKSSQIAFALLLINMKQYYFVFLRFSNVQSSYFHLLHYILSKMYLLITSFCINSVYIAFVMDSRCSAESLMITCWSNRLHRMQIEFNLSW